MGVFLDAHEGAAPPVEFASFADVLMHALRRLGLEGTALARAQYGTIREDEGAN